MAKKTISNLKTGLFSRSLKIAKIATQTSLAAGRNTVQNYLYNKNQGVSHLNALHKALGSQAETIAKDLGELKGSLMKAGQALSMYGEHFLPPEANEFLKTLQNQSPALDWNKIEKTLRSEFSLSQFEALDIDQTALAAASLGQAHIARVKKTNEKIVLKVQYPGVAEAVDSDIRVLKLLLSTLKLIPKDFNTDEIFAEVRTMLLQELDYLNEAQLTDRIFQLNQGEFSTSVIIPKLHPEFSTSKVIATTFIEGHAVDSEAVQSLPQELKNKIASEFLNYFFNEFFNWGYVQTDPHLGNYKIQFSPNNAPHLVALDFGATRQFDLDFRIKYARFLSACLNQSNFEIEKTAIDLKYLEKNDPSELKSLFFQFCKMTMEPYLNPSYNWGNSDLPDRLNVIALKIIKGFPLRSPPKESLFLDRKTGGVFIFLKVLKAEIESKQILEKYLNQMSTK